MEFYKFFWPSTKDKLTSAISHFFAYSFLPSNWGKTFIILVPKKENPCLVSDYRPILLCNVRYKIISKILSNHLKVVLPCLAGREQVGFVFHRGAFDNINAVQEITHSVETNCNGPSRMLILIDIEKAYDTLTGVQFLPP